MMFVPGGQGFGAALIMFGADVVIQKATTGEVNWLLAGLNLVGFGAGGVASRIVRNPVVREAVEDGVEGAVDELGEQVLGQERLGGLSPEPEGIVYLRTDPSGQVKPYIGRSESGEV
ncbi:hypothetical protein N2K95_07520 [Arthrobacter zhaoxinii]|uniref:Uncharacterized protein n=1 Tax=Arthrobacter zhaoxinii TaxID=2964616 RepID=A0ABY5YUL8_9MICC|nr:hypothetical protein [Arthrobacter zhaoxinii]UWX98815.1 hypothetical protein N2K95_07520 [Arthrobacter zhaoxinii]